MKSNIKDCQLLRRVIDRMDPESKTLMKPFDDLCKKYPRIIFHGNHLFREERNAEIRRIKEIEDEKQLKIENEKRAEIYKNFKKHEERWVQNAGFLYRGDIAEKDMLALKPIHKDK